MCVQYIGGCSVPRGVFSTSGGYHEYIGGISLVHRGMFSPSGDIMMNVGGYHEYIGRCSLHRRDIIIHMEEQLDKILSISIENSDVLNIPRCTHGIPRCTEHPLMYSWYPPHVSWYPPLYWTSPDVLMISPRCTHGTPPMYWTSPDVLMVSLRCTEHPPMYSWYPPDVLMVSPRCTEHPPMYWTSYDVLNTHYTGCVSIQAKTKPAALVMPSLRSGI